MAAFHQGRLFNDTYERVETNGAQRLAAHPSDVVGAELDLLLAIYHSERPNRALITSAVGDLRQSLTDW